MVETDWLFESFKIVLTASLAGVAAFLSIRIFPLKAKKAEWYWQKSLESETFLLESFSQIMFLTNDHISSEYDYQFSMIGDKEASVDARVRALVMELHSRSALLIPYLNKSQCRILQHFLERTQVCYDEGKRTWGDWDPKDQAEEADAHLASIFSDLYTIADECLEHFKFEYVKQKK